jgi:hypothetical protein
MILLMTFVNLSCGVCTPQKAYLFGLVNRQDKEHEAGHRGGSVVSLQAERRAEIIRRHNQALR